MGTICVKVSNFFGGYTLKLPLKDSELARELEKARCGPDNTIYIAQMEYPEGLRMLNGSSVDADELNFLAKSIDRYVQSEYDQFMAAASITKNVDVEKLIKVFEYSEELDTGTLQKLADHLDEFIVISGVETATDIAEYFIQHEDGYWVDECTRDFVDLQKMGECLIDERDGQFVSGEFVCMQGRYSFEQIMGRESQSMEIGGM